VQALDAVDPVRAGHAEVHQHDLGTPALDQAQQLRSGVGLAHDPHVLDMLDRAAYAGDDQG
jgi:hypothetical protein